ncbi:MAG: hypothetical protein ABI091_31705 [Ferruginibacter sp.]
MTDITININTGSENSEPRVTTTKDNTTIASPKAASPKIEIPKTETTEETTSEKDASKKDGGKKMDMTEEEHAKMGSEK